MSAKWRQFCLGLNVLMIKLTQTNFNVPRLLTLVGHFEWRHLISKSVFALNTNIHSIYQDIFKHHLEFYRR